MDEAVKPFARVAAQAAVLASCMLGAARAELLADPTRPPAVLAQAAAGPAGPAPAGPVLQSVLIGRQAGGRRVAVIDGETVRLGASFRGAVLVRMTETEVELQRGANREVLKLFVAASQKSAK
jgi:MSHA biogenesis protein MshK